MSHMGRIYIERAEPERDGLDFARGLLNGLLISTVLWLAVLWAVVGGQ